LGFKLLEAGKGLLDFVTFMERHHASYITSRDFSHGSILWGAVDFGRGRER
jgi:hypothetical protein